MTKDMIPNDVYFEVNEVLNIYPNFFKKLPKQIAKDIEKKANKCREKNPKATDYPFENISNDALKIITYLYCKYADNSDKEGINKIKDILMRNEIAKANATQHIIPYEIDREITPEVQEILAKVQIEVEEETALYFSKDEVGYTNFLYETMRDKLKEYGIELNLKRYDIMQFRDYQNLLVGFEKQKMLKELILQEDI